MTQNPLESTYRPIRRVAPPDVPIAGVLAAEGDHTVLLADVDAVPSPWWRDDPAAHLLAPVDVARRADGHDAVLPWCVVTVGSYLRARADEPLSGGEGVTLAVSLMRGCAEAALPARFGDDPVPVPHGRWWLTDQGRPLFAVGEGAPAREETAELLSLLAGSCADRVVVRLATEAADSIRVRSPASVLVRLEEDMFEACAPRPLLVRVADPSVLRPMQARELRSRDGESDRSTTQFIGAGRHDEPRRGSSGAWAEALRSTARKLVMSRGGREDAPRKHSRRTPVLLGASLAAVILTVGLLWPQPDGDGPAAVGATSSPPASDDVVNGGGASGDSQMPPATPAPTGELAATDPGQIEPTRTDPQPVATPDLPDPADPATPAPAEGVASPSSRETEIIATAAALLGAVAACGEQDTCGPLVADGVGRADVPAGGAIELVEDFGGVVVMRVIEDQGETSLLSIEQVDGAWRIREVTAMPG
ncbi:hypothetical protein [Microbacterium gorillae]|uniref:hypothetical protein n=1 Tax=Microbacterium gorillae TaxID=1231063 RepID=UPI003D979861